MTADTCPDCWCVLPNLLTAISCIFERNWWAGDALVKVVACIKAGVTAAVELDLARAADGAHVAAEVVTHHAHHALQLRQPLRLNRHSKTL